MDDIVLNNTGNNTDVFQYGATWLRVDFHLHTQKDKEFLYVGKQTEYYERYISRLVEEKIQIGVITNHNKFDKDEFRELKKRAKKENIWLLPGVELSVNDGANGIHCLIVFDEHSWLHQDNYIAQFLMSAFEGIHNPENENERCNYNLAHLLTKLEEHQNSGRDSFVVLAHVEQNCGFFEELDGGRVLQIVRKELFRHFVLGLQKIRTYDKIATYQQWFGELPAFVEGSDCKSIEEVGKASTQNGEDKKTYIKIGDFNFEALKYALIDHVHRVSETPIYSSNTYIKSIQFIGGKLDGKIVYLSSELNSFIGIRGSGKSSIIEILRYALGINLTHSSADESYKNDLISYIMGSGGEVIVVIHNKKDGQEYRIEKIYGQKAKIYNNLTNELQDCSIEAIIGTPIYFGQKDLSNKQENFESDLLQRLIGTKLQEKDREIRQKCSEIIEVISEMGKINDLDTLKEETEKVIKDAEQHIAYFKATGVEQKLKSQTLFEQDVLSINKQKEVIQRYSEMVDTIISEYDGFFSKAISGSELSQEIFAKANVVQEDIQRTFQDIREIGMRIHDALHESEKLVALMDSKRSDMAEDFAKIKREINSDTLNPDTFISLNRMITTSKIKMGEIDKQISKKKELQAELLTKLEELEQLWHGQFLIKEQEINKINHANENLKLEIDYKGQRSRFHEEIKNGFRGTNIRDATYQSIRDNFVDFVDIYRNAEKFAQLFPTCKEAFFERFSSIMSELLTFRVEDRVVIKYKGKTLAQHSLGQRASALIVFLLAQKDNDILIIDQPEDDLDNQTIYDEVIKEILKLKGKMQFVFATHNANIPVLGDSECIVECDFEDSTQIKINEGTIDTPATQKAIVSIMEGGKDAFNKRKNIYNMWK